MKKWFCLIIFMRIFIGVADLFAQEPNNYIKNFEDKLFPSPTASSLVGGSPTEIKKSTGGLLKTVDLARVPFGNFNYDLSLNYYSNGVKVNDWGGRCGINWEINSTGIITREVRGIADEKAYGRFGDSRNEFGNLDEPGFTQANYEKLKQLSSKTGKIDGQYDLFSYNIFGLSGSFIIRNGQAILLNDDSKIKITVQISQYNYRFNITDTEGNIYSFNSLENTKYDIENECDNESPYAESHATAWFLDNIKFPNQKTVKFSYSDINYNFYYDFNESRIYQEYSDADLMCSYGMDGSVSSCFRRQIVNTKLLISVVYDDVTVGFEYSDRNDLLGDKLLKKITVSKNSSPIKDVFLDYYNPTSTVPFETLIQSRLSVHYDKEVLKRRYFLSSVKIGGDNEGADVYRFQYNGLSLLPHRFSFSQDHYGYYNGKSNTTSIPKESFDLMNFRVYNLIKNLPQADRSPQLVGKAGLLTSINYPTRGIDSILYDQNQSDEIKDKFGMASFTDQVASGDQQSVTNQIDLNGITGNATIKLQFVHDPDYEGIGENQTERFARVRLLRNNGIVDLVPLRSSVDLFIGNSFNTNVPLNYPNGTKYVRGMKLVHEIQLDANNENLLEVEIEGKYGLVNVTVDYSINEGLDTVSVPWMGYRVSKIISNPKSGGKLQERNFVYKNLKQVGNKLEISKISSLNKVAGLEYETLSSYYCEQEKITSSPFTNTYYFLALFRFGNKLNSSPNVFGSSPIIYSNITTLFGDQKNSFEASLVNTNANGKDQRILAKDFPFIPLISPNIDNSGWQNGLESKRFVGTVLSDGTHMLSKSLQNFYSANTVDYFNYSAYELSEIGYVDSNLPFNFNWYIAKSGTTSSHWVKLDSIVEEEFVNGLNSYSTIKTKKRNIYNPIDKKIFEEYTTNSKGAEWKRRFLGPAKMVELNKDPQGVYQSMLNNNFYSPIVEEQSFNGNLLISESKFQFYNPLSNIFVPKKVDYAFRLGSSKSFSFPVHNVDGKIVEVKDNIGLSTVYIWGYNSLYPIAKVQNATYAEIEAILTKETLAALNAPAPPDSAIQGAMSKLRNSLTKALVTSYTYAYMVGMTSKTDPRGITEYYEYDGMQRLQKILDQFKYINKTFDYNFRAN